MIDTTDCLVMDPRPRINVYIMLAVLFMKVLSSVDYAKHIPLRMIYDQVHNAKEYK